MKKHNWQERIIIHKKMLAALESGTATPEQQKAALDHIRRLNQQNNEDARDAQRDARDAYSAGRSDEREELSHD